MHAFFFGNIDSPLYGVSHSPTGNDFKNSAILILNPQGHEYIRSHKALRQLADTLASAGYFVLRFDYQATGDSRGALQDITLDSWKENIKIAADELRSISGQKNITAVGLRLGASLAVLSNEMAGFKNVILWDPVISGENYINNLENLQSQLLANKNSWFNKPLSASELSENELLGYQYSEAFLSSMKKLNLLTQKVPAKLRVKHFSALSNDDVIRLNNKLENDLRKFSYYEIDDMGDWDDIMKIDSALLVHKITNKIVEELG